MCDLAAREHAQLDPDTCRSPDSARRRCRGSDARDADALSVEQDLGRRRQKKGSLQCSRVNKPFAEDTCDLRPGQSETIAGVTATEFSLNFFSDRLHQMIVIVPATQHAKVTAALRKKWGPPTKSETGAMGMESSDWKTATATLSVTLFPALGRANVQFETNEWAKQQAQRLQAEEGPGPAKAEPSTAALKQRCESGRAEDEQTCVRDLGRAIDASRSRIARDDDDPARRGAKCEPLLYEKTERATLVESTRTTFIAVLNTGGTEELAKLPMITMIHRALKVVCLNGGKGLGAAK
ncbi:MAG: hypothetical protein ABIS92_13200 [Polyangia bacterium]